MLKPNLVFAFVALYSSALQAQAESTEGKSNSTVDASASNYTVNNPPTQTLWNFGIGSSLMRLSDGGSQSLSGPAARVTAGYSLFVSPTWLSQAQMQIYSGPWNRIRQNSFDADFSGIGFAIESLWSLTAKELRSGDSSLAGMLALSYADISGKSVGENRHYSGIPDDKADAFLERKYSLNIQALLVEGSLVWCYFHVPRPSGNTTELLTTRTEGVGVRLGAGAPVYAIYRANSLRREYSPIASKEPVESVSRGKMGGYYLFLGVQTWIGS